MLPRSDGGVVDPKLIVYGTSNVRVVDLSIVPLHVSSHVRLRCPGFRTTYLRLTICFSSFLSRTQPVSTACEYLSTKFSLKRALTDFFVLFPFRRNRRNRSELYHWRLESKLL
jgi:hypothetical protein